MMTRQIYHFFLSLLPLLLLSLVLLFDFDGDDFAGFAFGDSALAGCLDFVVVFVLVFVLDFVLVFGLPGGKQP